MSILSARSVAIGLLACLALATHRPAHTSMNASKTELGAFSVSLAVKDIAASRTFYETLGFSVAGGDQAQNWLVLRSGATTIGLFQGMFPDNCLTFNPGWSPGAQPLESFEDVRSIQHRLKQAGLTLTTEADEASTGPAHFTLVDPDGNPVLFDQHVPKPTSAREQ